MAFQTYCRSSLWFLDLVWFVACLTNQQVSAQVETEKRYFQGLASPAAAAVVAGVVWVGTDYEQVGSDWRFAAIGLTLMAGIFMVSNIRYRSFKDLDLKGRVPFMVMLAIVLIFVLISLDPPQVLFMIFFGYALYGPLVALWQRYFRGLRKK